MSALDELLGILESEGVCLTWYGRALPRDKVREKLGKRALQRLSDVLRGRRRAPPPASRPILFSGEMVRAILEGRKTVSRRVVKKPPGMSESEFEDVMLDTSESGWNSPWPCPYGEVSDHLWVRETWQAIRREGVDNAHGTMRCAPNIPKEQGDWVPVYRATMGDEVPFKWRPSIFMPRWASRLTLKIECVKPERLQDIQEEDAIREGVTIPTGPPCPCEGEADDPGPHVPHCAWRHPHVDPYGLFGGGETPREVIEFACLWDSIYAKQGYGWEKDPWVWALQFKVVT